MAKYSCEQLSAMAQRALEAKAKGDIRYIELVTLLSYTTERSTSSIEASIVNLVKDNKEK